MTKEFNVTGICIPELHYMVDVSNKIDKIMDLIKKAKYFTINRPRQFGKTTTLYKVRERLQNTSDFAVIDISFEGFGEETFNSEANFIDAVVRQLKKSCRYNGYANIVEVLDKANNIKTLDNFSDFITELIMIWNKNVVLIIDEVDKSSNNGLFLSFLGMLRNKYLLRIQKRDYTFHSVILAGVHDVKTLKLNIRPDDDRKYNSPWNIAVNFDIDMSFSTEEISTMIEEYCKDKRMNMNIHNISEKIRYYTSGYPFLVSSICKVIDEKLLFQGENKTWSLYDIDRSVKQLLNERNTNFESLIKNLENNLDLYNVIYEIIIDGQYKTFNIDNPIIDMGVTYGIFKNHNGRLSISNRVYEQRIYNYMSSKIETSTNISSYNFRDNFIEKDGNLDFQKILLKFQEFMKKEYSSRDTKFLERNGRLLFLAFIKPIINGTGFDFKEVQISEEKRLDVVVTYNENIYVSELKIWRGEEAHKRGIKQLVEYLNKMSLDRGYLLIYDFTKGGEKEYKQNRIMVEGKDIFIVWV